MRAAYGKLREPPAVALALTLAPVVAGVKVLGRQLCTHLAASFCRPSWCASPQHSSRERGWWHENEVEICRRGHEEWAGGARSSSVLRYGGCGHARTSKNVHAPLGSFKRASLRRGDRLARCGMWRRGMVRRSWGAATSATNPLPNIAARQSPRSGQKPRRWRKQACQRRTGSIAARHSLAL